MSSFVFSEVFKEMTVQLQHLPQEGDLFDVGDRLYQVSRVHYIVHDLRDSEPDHPHKCQIKLILDAAEEPPPTQTR